MCKPKTPSYTPPPEYADPKKPDNAALYASAQSYAQSRGGGSTRSTVLSGLQGVNSSASTTRRTTTALG